MGEPASFGAWLKRRRRALDLTQDALARLVGCSSVSIRKFESDEQRPSRALAERLAAKLQIPQAELEIFVRYARLGLEGSPPELPLPVEARLPAPSQAIPIQPEVGADTSGVFQQGYLPTPATALIGREAELTNIAERLHLPDVRLMTLTGAGGSGKTRIALQAATMLAKNYRDGAWFVDLSALADPALVAATVCYRLGVPEMLAEAPDERLLAFLRAKQLLLVLDNFEHVLVAADLVAALMAGAPGVHIIATSRVPLQVYGEHEVPIGPLALPDVADEQIERIAHSEAVRLFVERARAIRPDFALTQAYAPAVAEICVRLDGLPLAIELAAARVRVFPPPDLLARLRADGSLSLLQGGARNLPARQQTIRNTIAWSYDLLNSEERALFRCLGIFSGGYDLAAAMAVCAVERITPGQIAELLEALVTHSLVKMAELPDGAPRFGMLETIREFALECLTTDGELTRMRRAHAAYYLALAEAVEPELWDARQIDRLDAHDREFDNLRAVFTWLLAEGDATQAARLAVALRQFWYLRDRLAEGRAILEAALAAGINSISVHAQALHVLGFLIAQQERGEQSLTRGYYEKSLQLFRQIRDQRGVGYVLADLCYLLHDSYWERIDSTVTTVTTRALGAESLVIGEALDDLRMRANALFALGEIARRRGEFAQAHMLHQEALEYRRTLGAPIDIAWSTCYIGAMAIDEGNLAAARALNLERLAMEQRLGHRQGIAVSLTTLGSIAGLQFDYEAAERFNQDAWRISVTSLPDGLGKALTNLASLAIQQGRYRVAETYLEQMLEDARLYSNHWFRANGQVMLGTVALDEGRLDEAERYFHDTNVLAETHQLEPIRSALVHLRGIASLFRGDYAGAREALEADVAWVRAYETSWLGHALHWLGAAYLALGDLAHARSVLDEGLRDSHTGQHYDWLALYFETGAVLAVSSHQPLNAARLWGAAEALRERIGVPMWPVQRPDYERRVAATREVLGETAFAEAWDTGQALTLDQAVELALTILEHRPDS